MESQLLAGNSSGAGDEKAAAAVRSGEVPPLADCFSTRPETVPGLADALVPGRPIVLTGPEARRHQYDWPGGTGKTQLAAYLAESLWRARQVELLVWVTATSRASVLASYAQAFADRAGAAPAGDAETAAARLVGWLATTGQRWLVVLDDVAAPADLEGLWPQGPACRVVVTTRSPVVLKSAPSPLVLPIGAFSSHEALTYLMARLSSDPDQRIGAVDLLEDLGREPLALAQASATIANSGLTCRDYRDLFARRKDQIAQALGGEPSAKAVTWTLSVEQADQLLPGRLAQPCLALAVLLDCHGIPGDLFSTPAACEFIGGHNNGDAPDAKRSGGALRSLERTGLLTIDPASTARTVRVHPVVQAAARSATPQPMRDQAARAAARALLQAWPADGGQPLLADALRSCAASLKQAAAESLWAGGCHAVLFQAGRSLDSAGLTGPAVVHWRSLASASERVLGPSHQDTLLAADRLASALLAAGMGAEAVALRQRTVEARSGAKGPDHPGTIAARADLGQALLAAGRPADAIIVLEAALAACRPRAGARWPRSAGAPGHPFRRLRRGRTVPGRHPARPAHAGRPGTAAGKRPSRHDGRPGAPGRRLPGGRPAEGRHRPRQAHPGGPGAGAGPRPPGHHRLPERARDRLPVGPAPQGRHTALRAQAGEPGPASGGGSPGHDHRPRQPRLRLSFGRAAGGRDPALRADHRQQPAGPRAGSPGHPDLRANLAQAYYAVGRLSDAVTLLRGGGRRLRAGAAAGHPLTKTVRESLQAIADD